MRLCQSLPKMIPRGCWRCCCARGCSWRCRRACRILFILGMISALSLLVERWRSGSPQDCTSVPARFNLRNVPAMLYEGRAPSMEVSEPGRSPEGPRRIYIHTSWRSGSSMVGELFNQHPDVFYVYEPMWHLWRAFPGSGATALQRGARDMLRSIFQCKLTAAFAGLVGTSQVPGANFTLFGWSDNKALCSHPLCDAYSKRQVGPVEGKRCRRLCRSPSPVQMETQCKRFPAVVVKGVRVLDLSVLEPLVQRDDVRIVHLVRDPRAVLASRLRTASALAWDHAMVSRGRVIVGGGHPRNLPLWLTSRRRLEFLALTSLEMLCESSARGLSSSLKTWLRDRYMLLRYEDLLLEPERSLDALFRFTGLEPHRGVYNYLQSLLQAPPAPLPPPPAISRSAISDTKPQAPPAFAVTPRDPHISLSRWLTILRPDVIRRLQNTCAGVMRSLGYVPLC
uniref:Sulfotransferase n=1 Tax=Eptatretus burgeri TaxID=7764 RepID=A0A8C4WZX7_EPTBU